MKRYFHRIGCFCISILILSACSTIKLPPSEFETYYQKIAPIGYKPVDTCYAFDYGENVDIDEVYNTFFSDFLIIGKSDFSSEKEDAWFGMSYGKKIGADVLIASRQYKKTDISSGTTSEHSTTFIKDSSGKFIGTQSSFTPVATTESTDIYEHRGYFLKNVNGAKSIIYETEADFTLSDDAGTYSGVWANDDFDISLKREHDKIIAFVKVHKKSYSEYTAKQCIWNDGDFMFSFTESTGKGIFLNDRRIPFPAQIQLNKFGFLEVNFGFENKNTVSFMKK